MNTLTMRIVTIGLFAGVAGAVACASPGSQVAAPPTVAVSTVAATVR